MKTDSLDSLRDALTAAEAALQPAKARIDRAMWEFNKLPRFNRHLPHDKAVAEIRRNDNYTDAFKARFEELEAERLAAIRDADIVWKRRDAAHAALADALSPVFNDIMGEAGRAWKNLRDKAAEVLGPMFKEQRNLEACLDQIPRIKYLAVLMEDCGKMVNPSGRLTALRVLEDELAASRPFGYAFPPAKKSR